MTKEEALRTINFVLNLYTKDTKEKQELLKSALTLNQTSATQSEQTTQPQNKNIETAPELKEIINKISDLLRQGSFPTENKTYSYKIKDISVKQFVNKLKELEITDNDSKRLIYNNICLPKEQNNTYLEQVKWETFRNIFTRKS